METIDGDEKGRKKERKKIRRKYAKISTDQVDLAKALRKTHETVKEKKARRRWGRGADER